MRIAVCLALPLLLTVGVIFAQPPAVVPKRENDPLFNLKTRTDFEFAGGSTVWGTVTKIGKNSVTLKCPGYPDKTKEVTREVFVVDRLAEGEVLKHVSGNYSYRWSDLKEGDKISLTVLHDDGEKKDYLYAICIDRRPGAKLPESQKPTKDVRYVRDMVLNDIENGEDVSEADIAKGFPPILHPFTKGMLRPGGLPGEYRNKLNIIRDKKAAEKEKKGQELKATPPPKNDDKK